MLRYDMPNIEVHDLGRATAASFFLLAKSLWLRDRLRRFASLLVVGKMVDFGATAYYNVM